MIHSILTIGYDAAGDGDGGGCSAGARVHLVHHSCPNAAGTTAVDLKKILSLKDIAKFIVQNAHRNEAK